LEMIALGITQGLLHPIEEECPVGQIGECI
jgi:hypothetical protein